jgi:hypothetical protein
MSSLLDLPWSKPFLNQIQDEYNQPPPKYSKSKATDQDLDYIYKIATEDDPFDVDGLKKEAVSKSIDIFKTSCKYGDIIVLSLLDSPFEPQWNTWWRAVRLLSPNKPVRIVLFGNSKKRLPPPPSIKIGPENINGGAAMRCDATSIVIYRKEEATRVLIHELLHASCSDPYYKDTPYIEADTEAWAEVLLCAMAAKGNPHAWIRRMREQVDWAVKQASVLYDVYKVRSSKDYAWRYYIGRLEVLRRLGIQIPIYKSKSFNLTSLKFTICEPKNV